MPLLCIVARASLDYDELPRRRALGPCPLLLLLSPCLSRTRDYRRHRRQKATPFPPVDSFLSSSSSSRPREFSRLLLALSPFSLLSCARRCLKKTKQRIKALLNGAGGILIDTEFYTASCEPMQPWMEFAR